MALPVAFVVWVITATLGTSVTVPSGDFIQTSVRAFHVLHATITCYYSHTTIDILLLLGAFYGRGITFLLKCFLNDGVLKLISSECKSCFEK